LGHGLTLRGGRETRLVSVVLLESGRSLYFDQLKLACDRALCCRDETPPWLVFG
jgi:hypothetical protein